jgi:hypothetical protein
VVGVDFNGENAEFTGKREVVAERVDWRDTEVSRQETSSSRMRGLREGGGGGQWWVMVVEEPRGARVSDARWHADLCF